MKTFTQCRKQCFKHLLLIFSIACFANAKTIAQITTQIGTGTLAPLTNSSIYSPICRFGATSGNDASRSNLLYTDAELNTAGIFSGATITKLAFYKIGTGATTAGFTFRIYMRNSSTTAPLSTSTTWANILSTHTLQYSTTTQTISAATGWVEFTLDNPFTYTGQNVEIAFDHDMSAIAGDPTTGPFDWQYTDGFASQIIGTVSTTPAGVATLNGTVVNYKVRPNIQISYISSTPCSGTPQPGSATVAPTVTCANTSAVLNLTGNTPEANQTYTWQESTSMGGPYTDISSPATTISYSITATATKYYRCAVRCGAGAPAYSDPVLLTVNPLFPGNTYTINNTLPTSGLNFNNFTDAFNAILCGVGGKTIFNVSAGQVFNENPPELQASGTVTDSIIFRKSGAGANPVIRPVNPGTIASSTTLGSDGDAVITINGGDYITFNGIDINTDNFTAGNDQFEYGYYLKKRSGTDACKNVTIKNAVITLTKAIYSFGIHVSNNSGTAPVNVSTTGGASENIKISGNTISNSYGGILVRGQATAAYYDKNIQIGVDSGNVINDFGGGASTAYGIYTISQDSVKIARNIVTSASSQTATMYGIYNTTATNGSVDIYNNTVTITPAGTTSTMYAISNDGGSTGTNNLVRIYNNTVTNCTYSTSTTGGLYLINQAASAYNLEIYGNSLTNNSTSPSTTGVFYMLYQQGSVVNQSKIYNNTITGNSKMTGTTGTSYAISCTGGSSSNNLIYNNVIDNITATNTSGFVTGINIVTGASYDVYKNKISGITNTATTTGAVYGITINSGGLVNNVYNNFISDLNAPTSTNTGSTTTDLVRGINIASTTALSTQNISFNTILLNASGGASFSTSGVYHTTSATATTSTLNMRNNIIVNKSSANGVGYVSAVRRSSANVLGNYGSVSNNNLFYVNSTSNQVIFYDGTNTDIDLASYKARVTPRESSSVSQDANFINGSSAPYDLHINTTIPTQIESGGVAISGITDDIDGNTRNASTPDIGADEFAGLAVDLTGPSISFTALPVQSICIDSKTITATITDASGVNVAAGTKPRLWYKKASENDVLPATNTSASNGWKYVEASNSTSPFTFTFNFSLLTTPLTFGDSVSYFVVAQDVVTTPNVGVSVAVFNNNPATVALSGSAFPVSGNIKGFAVLNQPNPISIKVSKTELCVSGSVILDVDGINTIGGSYQWQSSHHNANNFTDIVGATTLPYTTATITDSTDYRLVIKCGGTPIATSPSTVVSVNVNNPQITGTTPGTRCGTGSVSLQATASPGAGIYWYTASTGGSSIASGSPFNTPSISATTTYYVSAGTGGTTQTANHGLPTVGTSTLNTGLLFDVYTDLTLNSVDVYPTTTGGDVVITLYNSAGTLLYTSPTFTVPAGSLSTPQTLTLDWTIPAGANYRILVPTHPTAFGYSSGSFPIPLGNNVGAVTTGATATGTTTLNYFIYSMKTTVGCNGARVPVVATIDNSPGCTPMPVNLLNFVGEKYDGYNKLSWSTASEVNNRGFELQRSTDGINFSKITFADSKGDNGNSNRLLQYSFDDVTPLKGSNYYRLNQVDKDGRSTFSKIVLIKGDKINIMQLVEVYPNPVRDIINVKFESVKAQKVTLVVTDVAGKIILQQPAQLVVGDNKIQLPVQKLSTGTYLIKIACVEGCEGLIHKFVKE